MIGKATHVPIVVRDQDKALEFYTEVIGFEKRQDYQQPGRPQQKAPSIHPPDPRQPIAR